LEGGGYRKRIRRTSKLKDKRRNAGAFSERGKSLVRARERESERGRENEKICYIKKFSAVPLSSVIFLVCAFDNSVPCQCSAEV
jgi:hypothetical protein